LCGKCRGNKRFFYSVADNVAARYRATVKTNPEHSEEARYSPKAETGLGFDEVMRRALKIEPEKPKKGSRPKEKKE
jgi:hypothetical protein